mgnify:CR=1 FL=1
MVNDALNTTYIISRIKLSISKSSLPLPESSRTPTLNGLPWARDGPIAQLGFSNSPAHLGSPWRLLVWFLGIKPIIKMVLQTCIGAMVSGEYFKKWKFLILFILSWNLWSQLLAGFKSWHTIMTVWRLLVCKAPKTESILTKYTRY